MKAMILAAGLGTRLRPLTNVRPKVLAPLMGMPVLDYWVHNLHEAGCDGIVVNAFHLHENLVAAVRRKPWPVPVHVRMEPFLLGTGGGIRNALDFFGRDPFVVINGDIVCRADLGVLHEGFVQSGAAAGLLLHDCPRFNNVAVKNRDKILGFGGEAKEMKRADPQVELFAFTGIHFMQPEILKDLPPVGFADILPVYRSLIDRGRGPTALWAPGLFWREMGSVEAYRDLHRELSTLPRGFLPPVETGRTVRIDPASYVAPDAVFRGVVVAGKGCRIEEGAYLEDVILWDDVSVTRGSRLRGCIVTDAVRVRGNREEEVITESECNGRDL